MFWGQRSVKRAMLAVLKNVQLRIVPPVAICNDVSYF